ncbi:MAG: quinone oxidoreductase [Gammaproteobacteria bacterium]|nr:quinone oxidoreductase [Gammaproteobacteria bacterium]
MSATMQAIQVHRPGDSTVLLMQMCSVPICGQEDVLVQVKAVGINYIDIYIRTGLYPPPHYPYVPGKEGSGIVVEVGGNVRDLEVGDRVAFCSSGSGTYAEYVAIPADQVVKIPTALSFETAAAGMLQGLTAYYLSHLTFPLNPDHIALIHAGAGGVGLLLIQMAKLRGARVITTVSTPEKMQLVQSVGADHVINYKQDKFLEAVMKLTDQQGVSVVYDSVGQTTFLDSLKSLTLRGMLVSFGQSSGPVPPFELKHLAEKSLYITRPTLGHYAYDKASLREMADQLFQMILSNTLKITVGQRYAFADVAEAHRDLEQRKTIGKSLLLI